MGVMRPRYQREIPDTRLRKVSEDEADAELNERGWAAAARKAVHISHLLEVVAVPSWWKPPPCEFAGTIVFQLECRMNVSPKSARTFSITDP